MLNDFQSRFYRHSQDQRSLGKALTKRKKKKRHCDTTGQQITGASSSTAIASSSLSMLSYWKQPRIPVVLDAACSIRKWWVVIIMNNNNNHLSNTHEWVTWHWAKAKAKALPRPIMLQYPHFFWSVHYIHTHSSPLYFIPHTTCRNERFACRLFKMQHAELAMTVTQPPSMSTNLPAGVGVCKTWTIGLYWWNGRLVVHVSIRY